MKKYVLLLIVMVLVAAAVWYAVNKLPRALPTSTGQDSAGTPSPAPRSTSRRRASAKAPAMPALGPVCGGHCGTERWPVKTLSDPDRDCVSLKPVDATVEELAALPEPAHRPRQGRVRPVECTVYRVEGLLGGWDRLMKHENDGDDHMVLFGRTNQRVSIIAEIPDPECDGACRSGFAEQFAAARTALESGVARPNPNDLPTLVRVTGVGFFDYLHHQIGVAPNGFELHPVLSIEFLPLDARATP